MPPDLQRGGKESEVRVLCGCVWGNLAQGELKMMVVGFPHQLVLRFFLVLMFYWLGGVGVGGGNPTIGSQRKQGHGERFAIYVVDFMDIRQLHFMFPTHKNFIFWDAWIWGYAC